MPSTVVHVAFAGLLGTALLADAFDTRAILVVMGASALLDLSGTLLVTDQRGLVQTFVELDAGEVAESTARGTTENTHYRTGFDPTRGESAAGVERIFPIAATGERFVLTVAGFAAVLVRITENR